MSDDDRYCVDESLADEQVLSETLMKLLQDTEAQLVKMKARRDRAKARELALFELAVKFAVVREGGGQRFSVDGETWTSTPERAVRRYLEKQ